MPLAATTDNIFSDTSNIAYPVNHYPVLRCRRVVATSLAPPFPSHRSPDMSNIAQNGNITCCTSNPSLQSPLSFPAIGSANLAGSLLAARLRCIDTFRSPWPVARTVITTGGGRISVRILGTLAGRSFISRHSPPYIARSGRVARRAADHRLVLAVSEPGGPLSLPWQLRCLPSVNGQPVIVNKIFGLSQGPIIRSTQYCKQVLCRGREAKTGTRCIDTGTMFLFTCYSGTKLGFATS